MVLLCFCPMGGVQMLTSWRGTREDGDLIRHTSSSAPQGICTIKLLWLSLCLPSDWGNRKMVPDRTPLYNWPT